MAVTQCPPGQTLVNGVCVIAGQETTSETPDFNQLYQNIGTSAQQTTAANIGASRAQTELAQSELTRQLEQQRQDYLKNRQSLQRETFLRGRNVLANLANRGLATSGLMQLGDVQRTVATGQQMNELSQAFENARQGLTAQQTQLGAQQTAFEAQQQAGLSQQLAGLGLQAGQQAVTEKERSVAYAESLAQLIADPNIPQATKDALAPLYEQLITVPQTQTQTAEDGTTTTTTGTLAEALGTTTTFTPSDVILGVTSIEGANLTTGERNELNKLITESDNLKTGSPFITALSSVAEGQQINPIVTTKPGNGGLNDTYSIELSGQQFNLNGKEMASLIMSGRIQVSPAIAVSILQGADGRITTVSGEGNRAFSKPYLQWLLQQGYITSRTSGGAFGGIPGVVSYDIAETVENKIR